MVLLFLGVVFLLVGFQAMGSGDDPADEAVTTTTSVSSSSPASPSPETARAAVRVFNISQVEGAGDRTADKLKQAGWTVAEIGNLELPNVAATTVYFGESAGERQSADEVGKLLAAPVEPRVPEVAEQPPGVIVVVTG